MTTLTDDLPPLPEPDYEARTKGMLGENCWTKTSVQAYARAAISAHEAKQAQAEPVGYVIEEAIPFLAECNGVDWFAIWNVPVGKTPIPLYTHPAPKREPLTPEKIRKWWGSENGLEDCDMAKIDDFTQVVRAVEAAHGIQEAP